MPSERSSDLFSGQDRIEHCAELGRPIRKGAPAELGVSDLARIRSALGRGDFDDALTRAAGLHAMYEAITGTFLEWCLVLPAMLAQDGHAGSVHAVAHEAYRRWTAGISQTNGRLTASAIEVMQQLLGPDSLSPDAIVEYRTRQAAGAPTRATALLAGPARLHAEFVAAAQAKNAAQASASYSAYVAEMRSRHDLAGEFVSSFAGAVQDQIGQQVAAKVLQDALESCAVLKSMWDLFAQLAPDLLAAVLAEHLRGHFSGTGREGAVVIIEETDRYRLVFDPCGTGGAMRRSKVAGLENFRDPSAETWHRPNQVPSYCAHCALNEMTSIQRLGYPAWVTEFDPDPDRPCGWTVYKDPALIPEHYFTRLGYRKSR